MANNLSGNMTVLTADQQAVISFESNAKADLTPAGPSFNTYLDGQPLRFRRVRSFGACAT